MPSSVRRFFSVLYLFLAGAIVFVGEDAITLGGFGVAYKYLIGLVVVALSLLLFVIYPEFDKMKLLVKFFFILALPFIVSIVYSMFIWIFGFAGLRYMTRGLFYPFYVIVGIATAAAFLYVLEEKAVWAVLTASVAICFYRIWLGIQEYGFAEWTDQWMTLIQTNGIDVGEAMYAYEEFNETLFGLGAFLIFVIAVFIIKKEYRKKWYLWALFFLAVFCFITGMKRIAITGIVVATVILIIGVSIRNEEKRWNFILFAGIVLVLFSIGYLLTVRFDFFTELAAMYGIDMKGRDDLYVSVNEWYSFSPVFLGHGSGYTSRMMSELAEEARAAYSEYEVYVAGEIHNDILRNYIDLGFYCFGVWLYQMIITRIRSFRKDSVNAALIALIATAYMFITYTTDNTYYYFQTNLASALTIMGFVFIARKERLDEKEASAEEKFFQKLHSVV